MEWDNLKYFLELARAGTLTAAARRLNVQHSTVARRISKIERDMGEPLFLRTQEGYRLNSAGHALMTKVEKIEEAIGSVIPKPQGEKVSGVVRIGCTEGYATYVLPQYLRRVRELYDRIKLELIVLTQGVKLPRNEADIVITIDRPERGPYTVQRLMSYELLLYASAEYIDMAPPLNEPRDLRGHRFVSYTDNIVPALGVPTIAEIADADDADLRSSSLNVQKAAVKAGCGVALLPIFSVDNADGLVPLFSDIIRVRRTYWMMKPVELQKVERVQRVWDILSGEARTFRKHHAQPHAGRG